MLLRLSPNFSSLVPYLKAFRLFGSLPVDSSGSGLTKCSKYTQILWLYYLTVNVICQLQETFEERHSNMSLPKYALALQRPMNIVSYAAGTIFFVCKRHVFFSSLKEIVSIRDAFGFEKFIMFRSVKFAAVIVINVAVLIITTVLNIISYWDEDGTTLERLWFIAFPILENHLYIYWLVTSMQFLFFITSVGECFDKMASTSLRRSVKVTNHTISSFIRSYDNLMNVCAGFLQAHEVFVITVIASSFLGLLGQASSLLLMETSDPIIWANFWVWAPFDAIVLLILIEGCQDTKNKVSPFLGGIKHAD